MRIAICSCGGYLDYIYHAWWRCRECHQWKCWGENLWFKIEPDSNVVAFKRRETDVAAKS